MAPTAPHASWAEVPQVAHGGQLTVRETAEAAGTLLPGRWWAAAILGSKWRMKRPQARVKPAAPINA